MNDSTNLSDLDVAGIIAKELWALAELRPDFEDLPTWIPQFEAATSNEHGPERVRIAAEHGRSVLRSVADHYATDADRVAFAQLESSFSQGENAVPIENFSAFFADAVQRAARFRKGVSRLPLAIHEDEIFVGRHTRISFNRTLRIPEDGREYPLPAGFGRLPILRVEDYAERVPEAWLEEGGFIIPLYQREALFIEFSGAKWRPTIAKIAVGRVNAITGKEHELTIRPHRQDYVVIPDQRWLDGINAGDGSVSQFVAMPLGKGFTVEAQITDEEKYGGFQLAVFDPKRDRFPERDPRKKEVATEDRKQRASQAAEEEIWKREAAVEAQRQRAFQAAQQGILDRLPEASARVIRILKEQHYREAAQVLGISEEEILIRLEELRLHFVEVLGEDGFDGVVPEEHFRKPEPPVSSKPAPQFMFMPATPGKFLPSAGDYQPSPRQPGPKQAPQESKPVVEMGIARGGAIKQQIFEDTYGAESWDESAFRDVVIHIVNSEVYQQITQREAPPTPISIEQYQRYKIPWFSNYTEKAPSLSPVAAFKRLLAVGQIEKQRGIAKHEDSPKVEIQPEKLVRIRTPTVEERFRSLLDRAVQSSVNGHHRIAAREASLALDLSDQHQLPFLIRAVSNHHFGYHSDAEVDATACIKLQRDNMLAFGIRAYSLLALGETLLAKNDAEMILASQPNDPDGLYIRAEANLRLTHYKEAVSDAERILRKNPANRIALRIRKVARTKLLEEEQAEPLAAPTFHNSVSIPKQQVSFKTLEEQLIETDHSAWGDRTMNSQPFWIAVREAAQRALTDQSQRVLFFQHYITFFCEASLLEIPLIGSWHSEWLALVFESAFDFANSNPERAEELMHTIASERSWAQQIVGAFKRSVLGWPAHDYVRRVVNNWKPENSREIADNGWRTEWLLESAESFFWAGIHTATEARQDPEVLELIEFFDISCTRQWGDSRLHINLLRTTPLCCEASTKPKDHPLLGIAAEKYGDNPIEGEIIGKFLEELCMKQELRNARNGLDSDLFVCQWVKEGLRFGERLLENETHTFAKMLQPASGYAGDWLLAFYERILAKVEDRTDPLKITRAFLEWQVQERDEVSPRYYGEQLETLLNCIDAAIYLPWAESKKDKS